jgi:hypothetical protein
MNPNLLISPDIPPKPALTTEPGEVAVAAPQTLRGEVLNPVHDGCADAFTSTTRGTILHSLSGDPNHTYLVDGLGQVWCWSSKTGDAQLLRGI